MKKPNCYNCKHSGEPFKVNGLTHIHCQNTEQVKSMAHDINNLSPWDSLCEWWYKCDKHEPKNKRE